MHGVIHAELQKFVIANHGQAAWRKLLSDAGLDRTVYLASQQYPDEEMGALLGAASRISGMPIGELLEQFGEFIVPSLLSMYGPLVKPEWRTLDLLEHTESTIHTVARLRNAASRPPVLRCTRVSPTEAILSYGSARRMCGLAKGIIRGVARHYGDTITIDELVCMHRGAPSCEISVALKPPAPTHPTVKTPVAAVSRSAASAK